MPSNTFTTREAEDEELLALKEASQRKVKDPTAQCRNPSLHFSKPLLFSHPTLMSPKVTRHTLTHLSGFQMSFSETLLFHGVW